MKTNSKFGFEIFKTQRLMAMRDNLGFWLWKTLKFSRFTDVTYHKSVTITLSFKPLSLSRLPGRYSNATALYF